jgi:hypothetical protein
MKAIGGGDRGYEDVVNEAPVCAVVGTLKESVNDDENKQRISSTVRIS